MKTKLDSLGKILEDHQLWLQTDGAQGSRADFLLADLEGANLKGANLQGANLKGADLSFAKLDLRFSYNNKHELNAYNDEIRIGCEVMSSKEWLNSYEELGKANGYSEDEIKAYRGAIKDYINKRSEK